MTTRLTIAEAQERARPHCDALGVSLDAIDWDDAHAEADAFIDNIKDWPGCGSRLRALAAILRAYQSRLDFETGAAAERANAAALLKEQAAKFERERRSAAVVAELQDARWGAACSELRTMAAYIERGDRAEGH